MSEDSNKLKNNEKKNYEEKIKQERKKPLEKNQKFKTNKPVIIRAEAYKTIILYANRYSNESIRPKDWKEIYGILIGYSNEDFVYVERAEALTYGHSTDVQLDAKHYVFIDEIQQKLDSEEKGHYIVGWFHSHPGLGLFFSYIDLLNQLGFQQNNLDFCGLVFDHTLLGKKKEEKIISEEGTEHIITKVDTGFEIFRITDINMDINAPGFDNNYHKVEYVVDGLNKFFFLNVLSELSSLFSAGKPLQSAYGEYYELESFNNEEIEKVENRGVTKNNNYESGISLDKDILMEIPIDDDMTFDVDDFFFNNVSEKIEKIAKLKEIAEQSIYEGNQAFKKKNAFMGIEKYRQGIQKYKELNEYERVLELLRNLSEKCISTNHYILAEEFTEDLFNLAEKENNLFYKAEGNYLKGYLILKKGDKDLLEYALKKIQAASVDYENAGDFAGAGKCYYQIAIIYQSRLNQPFNACLFYEQAIRSYNDAILRGHPLRKSLWSKPESLSQKILELKDIVEELISNIENPEERDKIKKDLDSIQLNF
ncbi:MAG: hypothetical protein ACFFAN_02560 [Promethearchaeota archaeon]